LEAFVFSLSALSHRSHILAQAYRFVLELIKIFQRGFLVILAPAELCKMMMSWRSQIDARVDCVYL
jgi:hypothetical protein